VPDRHRKGTMRARERALPRSPICSSSRRARPVGLLTHTTSNQGTREGSTMREYSRVLGLLLAAVLLPAAAVHAQVITGNVKDASGAVLPGVTVEVSSPALI